MVTIGVLGANGQVGAEVCLLLNQMDGVRVVPICRTELGSTLLRRCGLECRHGKLDNPAEATRLLAGCDLVADFTLPQDGVTAEIRATVKQIVTAAIQTSPGPSRFVYISTLMAFGFASQDQMFRHRFLSRTLYGSTKRYAERLAFRLGRRLGREVFVLRLGQVHGELQSVSSYMLRKIENETAYIPVGPSYAVFAYTIAEALVKIARGEERPGRYSLISAPDWSWREVYEYYARRKGIEPNFVTFDFGRGARSTIGRAVIGLAKRMVANPLSESASRHRELITGYVLRVFPTIERRVRATWGCRRARAEVAQMVMSKTQGQYRPFDIQIGKSPGERLRSLSDCRTSMVLPVIKVQRLLQDVIGERNSVSGNIQESLIHDVAVTMP
jgi:nucleoside-diphosphate-sugar epimerase